MKYLIVIAAMMLTFGLSGQTRKDVTEAEVKRVHEKALTVDTHCDTPMSMVTRGFDIGKKQATGQVDLHRMKEGGLDAMFFVAFVGQKPRTAENYEEAYRLAHQMLDSTIAQTERSNHLAEIALTSKDADRIGRKGKRAVYLALENGFSLAKDLTRIEEFYNKGARYITLSHSYHNDICDSSTDRAQPEHNGLSAFGHEVVEEMNRLGMMIDVSHISDKAFNDVISGSKAPVIASHSSVRSIARSDRNMTDDMIVALAKKEALSSCACCLITLRIPTRHLSVFRKTRRCAKYITKKGVSCPMERRRNSDVNGTR
jgi:membrane dipeptidase